MRPVNRALGLGNPLPELRQGPVVLRPFRRSDERSWERVRQRNVAWTGPWDPTTPPAPDGAPVVKRPADFTAMVRSHDELARTGRSLPFGIFFDDAWPKRRTPSRKLEVGGQMTVSNIVLGAARFATAGYWVDEQLAGRGVAPMALAMVIDHCFAELGLHRVEVNIRPENSPSIRVAEKLHMQPEGLRRRYLHIDGDWRDHLCFALLAEDAPEGVVARLLADREALSRTIG